MVAGEGECCSGIATDIGENRRIDRMNKLEKRSLRLAAYGDAPLLLGPFPLGRGPRGGANTSAKMEASCVIQVLPNAHRRANNHSTSSGAPSAFRIVKSFEGAPR